MLIQIALDIITVAPTRTSVQRADGSVLIQIALDIITVAPTRASVQRADGSVVCWKTLIKYEVVLNGHGFCLAGYIINIKKCEGSIARSFFFF